MTVTPKGRGLGFPPSGGASVHSVWDSPGRQVSWLRHPFLYSIGYVPSMGPRMSVG